MNNEERSFTPSSKLVDVSPPPKNPGLGSSSTPVKAAESLTASTYFHDQATAMYEAVKGLHTVEEEETRLGELVKLEG